MAVTQNNIQAQKIQASLECFVCAYRMNVDCNVALHTLASGNGAGNGREGLDKSPAESVTLNE